MAADAGQLALLSLQDLDTSLDRLRVERDGLPERAAHAAASSAVASAEAGVVAAEAAAAALAASESTLETELGQVEARAELLDKRMRSGELTQARDLVKVEEEIAHLRARATELEDQAMEVLVEREEADAAVVGARAAVVGAKANETAAAVALDAATADVMARGAAIAAGRPEAALAVPETLLAEYEKLRPKLGGSAVARLVGDKCEPCFMIRSARDLDRLRHLPAEAIERCEECSRILVRP